MMLKRSARIAILSLGLASATSSLAPPRARAQAALGAELAPSDVALAEKLAAEAFEAYRVHDYGRAVALYEQALAAAPSPDILYNLARVYDLGLGNRPLAIEYYQRFSAHPGAASGRLETASQRLIELREAERATEDVEREHVDAIAREFPIDVPAAAPAPGAPLAPAPVDAGLRPLEIAALVAGSAGLVGIGIGVGFGLSARARTKAWRRDCDGNLCTSQHAVDAAESASRRARVATIGFATGGGLLALGAVLWLIDTDNEQAGAAALSVSPVADGSSVGGRLTGRF
jgi:hypothetical protein